jgi:FKBP-type peptidyl-prolyl cis-trans isomerase 2
MSIKKGDKVTLEYEGKLDNGKIFDSTKTGQKEPLKFEIGSGKILRGFEDNIIGMKKGEEKEFSLGPAKAYGEINPELKKEIPKNIVQGQQEPKKGMMLMLASPDGRKFPALIEEVKNNTLVIDLNHPLAGKNLNFNVKVIDIESSNKEEKDKE